ncbi:MAG: hypothetical protein L3J26_04145 [Candidatus Polarisedimenticolaceae bacterium]|nr:hypothetical protein [Candidatus Polarisedimenticolaceae bacterium]
MSIYTFREYVVHCAAAIIAISAYCGLAQAGEKAAPQEQELRAIITGLTVEGLSLSLTPSQAHDNLLSAGYQVHQGTEPGHGIYWKNESKRVTKRVRLKSSEERIYQIQFSFAEKSGMQAWQPFLNEIKTNLGRAISLCEKATGQALDCLLLSESPTQLSAEITTSQSKGANRIKVRLDQRTSKISIKSNISFGSPRK